jgi:hypothetical protein
MAVNLLSKLIAIGSHKVAISSQLSAFSWVFADSAGMRPNLAEVTLIADG